MDGSEELKKINAYEMMKKAIETRNKLVDIIEQSELPPVVLVGVLDEIKHMIREALWRNALDALEEYK